MSTSSQLENTARTWWQQWQPRLLLLYLVVAVLLLTMSIAGHLRLLQDVGKPFGGFFWAVDADRDAVVVVSTPAQLPAFALKTQSITSSMHITEINGKPVLAHISAVYQQAHAGEQITYIVRDNNGGTSAITRGVSLFTLDMWWQNYGLSSLAGLIWLIVGAFLVYKATKWNSVVEGITLLPPAILLLLYSQWGNVQQLFYPSAIVQLIWIPSFALLGAAFIHLSLTYHPLSFNKSTRPSIAIDLFPYLPLLALLTYEWGTFLLLGRVPMRINLSVSLGYAVIGGLISFCIGINTFFRLGIVFPPGRSQERVSQAATIPLRTRHRVGDLLTLWIGGVGLGVGLGVFPILLTGQPLLPLSTFFIVVGIYPLILLYAIRSLRLLDRLQLTLDQREVALQEQRRIGEELMQTNQELQQATSLLLHADAHLRSLLSQRIHDQPRQQALRIRSLLAHWQHKLRIEAERDPESKVTVQPLIEVLGKVRKVSEELEGDLRGLQLLVEDVYQRRSLGLKLHLEKLLLEDLPGLHPESPLKVWADLWALDALSPELEQTEEGAKIAEAIAYTITQALLNIYNHAGATTAQVRTRQTHDMLEIEICDDGRGFDPEHIPLEKTSLFKAQLKAREAGGTLHISSVPRPQVQHGTLIQLSIPLQAIEKSLALPSSHTEAPRQTPRQSTQAF
ncbi:MAG TPA: hypothetical protein VGN34_09355 [Ktedonobacteraceae bacterium]